MAVLLNIKEVLLHFEDLQTDEALFLVAVAIELYSFSDGVHDVGVALQGLPGCLLVSEGDGEVVAGGRYGDGMVS